MMEVRQMRVDPLLAQATLPHVYTVEVTPMEMQQVIVSSLVLSGMLQIDAVILILSLALVVLQIEVVK
jgi:hypothetical protein